MKTIICIVIFLATLSVKAWELYRFGPTWNWVASAAESDGVVAKFDFPAYEPATTGYMAGALTTTSPYFTGDLRGRTITCRVSLETNGAPDFVFGGEGQWNTGTMPPHFKMFITSANGPFSVAQSNVDQLSYWWCQAPLVSLDTLAGNSITFSVNFTTNLWSAAHGQSSADYPVEFQDCVSRIQQIGLMFGGGNFDDVGCAVMPGTGTATLTLEEFDVTPHSQPSEPVLIITPGLLTVIGPGSFIVERSDDLFTWAYFATVAGGETIEVTEGFYRARSVQAIDPESYDEQ